MIRIGLMGGTFNPLHLGHLISADEIMNLLELEQVFIIPCSLPPHKEHDELIDSRHRLAMASLATASNPRLIVSSIEIERGGRSYTIDTIRALKKAEKNKLEIYFIVGVDVFSDIANWKEVDNLLRECHFVVTNRPGYDESKLVEKLNRDVASRHPDFKFALKEKIHKKGIKEIFIESSPYSIFLVHIPTLDISSTEIRRRVALGRPVKYLLTPEVRRYISEHELYTEKPKEDNDRAESRSARKQNCKS
jgi:nicotinate-nucleotide adenylyltransferase